MARTISTQQGGRATAEREAPLSACDVARVAYGLFERRGCVDGYDQQDWFEAERIVRERQRRRTI